MPSSMDQPQILNALFPELLWHKEQFQSEYGILISERGILSVGPAAELKSEIARRQAKGEYVTNRRLGRRA